jgi:GT2 family glycosyltransferase
LTAVGSNLVIYSVSGHVCNSTDIIPVIVLNWNGEGDTIECLQSIRGGVAAGFVPVIVDNGSSAGSLEKLRVACSRIYSRILFVEESELRASGAERRSEFRKYLTEDSLIFIENSENMGFAKGSNIGTRFAEMVGAEWVMLLNNDTIVQSDTFQQLRAFRDSHPAFLAITPQIRQYSERTRILNCGGKLTYFGSLKYNFAGLDSSQIEPSEFSVITFITGCALLFKYRDTGPLTEDFFFGEEDYEFSLRMRKLALPMACCHGAVVHHKVGTTITKNSKKLGQILVYYVNRLINTRNYYSKLRWHTTKILAYFYLPILFARSGVDPRRSLSAARWVENFIRRNRDVSRADFQTLILRSR